MQRTNNYPIVLVHGFIGWGADQKIGQFLPYYGMWNGNAKVAILEDGIPCFAPSVGPFSSMWDRACVLYAQLKGGRVDFGKVHSEKYGHDRYGDTYEALIPDWGELSENGKLKKISLIGHSFGGPTMRQFIHLLAEGSEEERAGTPADELSPLFEGGKAKWIHSCTSLSGTHNGATALESSAPVVNPIQYFLYGLGNVLSGTKIAKYYNWNLDRFGISSADHHIKLNKEGLSKYVHMKMDNIFYELSFDGAMEATKDFKPYDCIYYFSYPAKRTKQHFGFLELPTRDMWLPARLASLSECLYKSMRFGKEWQPNDGFVNVMSTRGPLNEPKTDFVSNEESKPGIWNVMPVEWKDHLSYMGVGETKEEYNDFFKGLAERSATLPVIE